MNLHDALDQVARDAERLPVPAVADVRRRGDDLRHQARRRTALLAAAAVAVASVTTYAVSRSSVEHENTPAREHHWQVNQTYDVPGAGFLAVVDGQLWVQDNKDRTMNSAGTEPAGLTYLLDEATGQSLGTIPHAVGANPMEGGGAVWLATQAHDDGRFNRLTRVDVATHEVTHAVVQRRNGTNPKQAIYVGDSVWVVTSQEREVVQVDPDTLAVEARISVGDVVGDDLTSHSAVLGTDLWTGTFGFKGEPRLVRVDLAEGRVASTLPLHTRDNLLGVLSDGTHLYAMTQNSIFGVDPSAADADGFVRQDLDVGEGGAAVAATGLDAIWVVAVNPAKLFRLDPDTLEVTDSIPLPGVDPDALPAVDLTFGSDTVWVRESDHVLGVSQQ